LAEVCSKEEAKEFVIQRLHLIPETLGKTRNDVPSIIHDMGGLQYGGHEIKLLNRFARALLSGCYNRLKHLFGYRWTYPPLSGGVVWRAAILCGRQLIGEATVDMYKKESFLRTRKFVLRKEFASTEILRKIETEFNHHAIFQKKTLQLSRPQSV